MGTNPQDPFQNPFEERSQEPFQEPSQDHPAPDDVIHTPIVEAYTDERRLTQARYAFLPQSLRGRVPDVWILILERNNRIVVEGTLFTVALLTLFSTVLGPPHKAEFVSLITAVLAPLGFTIWNVLFPLNPYQTFFFTKQGLQGLDERDRAARELSATLSSPAAGQFLWRRTRIFWVLFFVPMVVVMLALRHIPALAADASWLIRVPIFCAALYAIIRIELMSWAFRSIKSSE